MGAAGRPFVLQDDGMPSEQEVMRPILEICYDGRIYRYDEVTEKLADRFKLTRAQRKELTKGNNEPRIYNRMRRAVFHMKPAGFVDKTGRGQFKITKLGKKIVDDENIKEITWSLLNKYSARAKRGT